MKNDKTNIRLVRYGGLSAPARIALMRDFPSIESAREELIRRGWNVGQLFTVRLADMAYWEDCICADITYGE